MAAETLCILGESGHGKSTSLRNLNPEETFIIATVPKPLRQNTQGTDSQPAKTEAKPDK